MSTHNVWFLKNYSYELILFNESKIFTKQPQNACEVSVWIKLVFFCWQIPTILLWFTNGVNKYSNVLKCFWTNIFIEWFCNFGFGLLMFNFRTPLSFFIPCSPEYCPVCFFNNLLSLSQIEDLSDVTFSQLHLPCQEQERSRWSWTASNVAKRRGSRWGNTTQTAFLCLF